MEKMTFLGCFVKPDGWNIGEKLIKETWDKADYRLPIYNGGLIKSLAVKIIITGRTERWDAPISGPAMRCKIIFVGDAAPDQETGGWIKIR